MTAVTEAAITKPRAPGVYDMPDTEYHADPALSSSGARKLLPPSCPALFKYEQDNPPAPKAVFELGHAAHRFVLGEGANIVRLDYDDWRTNAAKAHRDEVRAYGGVPLLADAYDEVSAMAAALRQHPVAAKLFEPGAGKAEQSIFWNDAPSGIMRRARLDWLPTARDGRLIIAEYKTCRSADPEQFVKAASDYGYHCQDAWYRDAARSLGYEDVTLVFVCQEKIAPYIVSVIELDIVARRIGDHLNRRAIDTYIACMSTDKWPGYVSDVEVALTPLPFWYERKFEDEIS